MKNPQSWNYFRVTISNDNFTDKHCKLVPNGQLGNLHVRLNFNLSKAMGIKHHSLEHLLKLQNLFPKCCKTWKI